MGAGRQRALSCELGASEGVRSFALHDCERKELDSKKGTCQGVTEGPHIRHSVFCATANAECGMTQCAVTAAESG